MGAQTPSRRSGCCENKSIANDFAYVPYDVKVDFDGTTFTLSIDGINVASMNAAATPGGTVGYRVKKTTGRFASICVN